MQFALGKNNLVVYLGTDGDIYAFFQNQPIVLQATNALFFWLAANGEVYYLGTDGMIHVFFPRA